MTTSLACKESSIWSEEVLLLSYLIIWYGSMRNLVYELRERMESNLNEEKMNPLERERESKDII